MRRSIALFTAVSTLVGINLIALPARAAPAAWPPRRPDAPTLVSGFAVPIKPLAADPAAKAAKAFAPQPVSWPSPGVAEVAPGIAARAGGLPVRVSVPARVEVTDPAAAHAKGVDGLLLNVKLSGPEKATLTVDYSSF